MKYLLIILLFGFSAVAQEGSAIISLDTGNVAYRGIENMLKINLPDVEQQNISVSAPGSLKRDDSKPGYYSWNVTSVINEIAKVTVTYKLAGGKTAVEIREFRVMLIPLVTAYIENRQSANKQHYYLTRSQIADLKLNTFTDAYHESGNYFKVEGFRLYLPKDNFIIEGNTIPDSLKAYIATLQTGSVINIGYIRVDCPYPGMLMKDVAPVSIEVVDDPAPLNQQDPLAPTTITYTPQKHRKNNEKIAPIVFNEKYETLYRGTNNHLTILYPQDGVKSCTFSAPGLIRVGHDYVDIDIPKGYTQNWLHLECTVVTKKETHTYTYRYLIKNIETRMLINGQGCEKCIVQQTLKELENALVSVQLHDLAPFNTVIVMSFIVTLPNGNTITVYGNHVSNEAHFFIEQFTKPGDIIMIENIRYRVPGVDMMYTKPRTIKILRTE